MAIINNNVQNVQFLRNQTPYASREDALTAIEAAKANAIDGTSLLARYSGGTVGESDFFINTIVGYVAVNGNDKYLTIIDVEGSSADVEELRQEINAKLGDGVGSGASETVTAQLTALSGNTASTSAETSVEGAKRYADELKNQMDYTGVTTGDGVYVTNVTQSDGIVSATTATLPTVSGEVESKKVVMSVSEDKGEITVDKGTIESSDKTVVISDLAEGNGIDFKVNIDGETLVADTSTGVISVASAALTQYVGDENTIHISSADTTTNTKTVSSLLTVTKVTTGLSEEVKEEYHLVGEDGITIGDPVKIYKDSHIVSINYIDDPADEHYQNLEYVYVNDSGATSTTYVDMSELVLEAEFASGLTIENHVARGVVDPASESFLTVGADGFKLSGVQDAIDNAVDTAVSGLDATVSAETTHVSVQIDEVDGKLTAVTLTEDDIASADDLAELSGKTITAITSNNSSITATIDDAVGNKSYNIETDASKIKMSGFTSTDALSGITSSSSITEAFKEVDNVITHNEEVTAAALTDLDDRIDTVSGDVDTIKEQYISGVSVNGTAVTPVNHVAPLAIDSTSAATTSNEGKAIVVTTNNDGSVTLNLAAIDCGYYE